ncbi:hypothetical protein SAMN04488127_0813 [Bhargavaea ginsengi]|uniref:Uncharacterized protein n=1 Tax=Bhargavaea ginsengi TaxID=426757 RepID=A0A1H6UQ38_9BACL|nr:hypothetical protein [Bhargavaea ginsengi]SEI92794.1 hypothetical protein SAMN04488127_0813 [Bhargavaea ginsengi]
MERSVLEITPSQYYFLAVSWMDMFNTRCQDDVDAQNREQFASMATEDLVALQERVGPQELRDLICAELEIRGR